MFGWFRQKKPITTSDRDWTVTEFRKRRQQINSADQVAQMAFAIVTAMHWKAFLAQHGSPATFKQLPRDQQMDYFRNWIELCQRYVVKNDQEKLISAEMISYYLAALINDDRNLETEAAAFLDNLTRKGWHFA